MTILQRIGLALAKASLWATGNVDLAGGLGVLPLIPKRQVLILSEPVDRSDSQFLRAGSWMVWRP
jgi:hypothetical protein